ncbi:MAG: plasmid recombination protein [Clostridia bacterium]|nr:plasmid recombination protein [Clostridia bacterium]
MERENERFPDYGCIDGHIDEAETKNNYHIIYPKGSYMDIMTPYLGTDPKKPKKAYVMSVVFTTDDDFFKFRGEACIRQFFIDATNFMVERFGKRNVFSAVVHVDEDRPHLHVNFLPYERNGQLMAIATKNKQAMVDFQDDIYEAVGVPWGLERGDKTTGVESRTHEEYLQARAMYRYILEVQDIIREIEGKRDELFSLQDDVESIQKTRDAVKREVRDLNQAKEALMQEKKRLMAEILKDTDLHAGIESMCTEPDPSRSKDESIRILKARNYCLQDKLISGQEETKDLLMRLKASEERNRSAEKYKAKAALADKIAAMFPEEWKELCRKAQDARGPARGQDRDGQMYSTA